MSNCLARSFAGQCLWNSDMCDWLTAGPSLSLYAGFCSLRRVGDPVTENSMAFERLWTWLLFPR
jgi:hypothetical protein